MAALPIISAVLTGVGTLVTAGAANAQGQADQQAAYYKAQMEERRAMEERAAAQRSAIRKRRDTEVAQSNLQARAAASGGGADDPTVIKLASDLEGEGEYQALAEMYKGESRARDLENQAQLDRFVGDQKRRAGRTKRPSRGGPLCWSTGPGAS